MKNKAEISCKAVTYIVPCLLKMKDEPRELQRYGSYKGGGSDDS